MAVQEVVQPQEAHIPAVARDTVSPSDPPFSGIRQMCTADKYDNDIDTSPHAFAAHRRRTWPFPVPQFSVTTGASGYAAIYDAVRSVGLPNCMGARVPLPSALNIEAWRNYINHDTDEADLLEYVLFGFPLGYLGPQSSTDGVQNHDSALRFPSHINDFIAVEIEAGALIGPFNSAPFTPWAHISPIMSRPKADGDRRRVITDLTFPTDQSVNAYIMKNSALGEIREHTLPTVANLVTALHQAGPEAYMFTVDIARAYKNFCSDPLDWPLLCLKWENDYYVDVSMPFGARASSCFMQRIANFITRVLNDEGIRAIMYLDDIVVVAPDHQSASRQYKRVRGLLAELGLPEAVDKAQPPATKVRWLGINVDAHAMTLSIPKDKVDEALQVASRYATARSINKRQLQSLIGKLVHVAKCVEPARIFISRLLDALRAFGDRLYIKVSQDMRADIAWFAEFAHSWNGVSLIPPLSPHKIIQVDACLTGVGATDGRTAYAARVAPDHDVVSNITEIEAANVVIALHTFITEEDAGGHIMVQCDNAAAVQVFTAGRAHNRVLAECARAIWMVQAKYAVRLSFSHIAGAKNQVADALSRAHTSSAYHNLAGEFINMYDLTVVRPCTYVLSNLYPPIICRSGAELAKGPGGEEAGTGPSTWDTGGTQDDGRRVGSVLPTVRHGPNPDDRDRGVFMDRISGEQGDCSPDHQEQVITGTHIREAGRRLPTRPKPHKGRTSHRGSSEAKRLYTTRQGCHTSTAPEEGTGGPRLVGQWTDGENGGPPHVFWRVAPVGGRPTNRKGIRPEAPPHEGRHHSGRNSHHHYKSGEKPSEVQSKEGRYIIPHRRPPYVPSQGSHNGLGYHTKRATDSPTTNIHEQKYPNAHILLARGMGEGHACNRG